MRLLATPRVVSSTAPGKPDGPLAIYWTVLDVRIGAFLLARVLPSSLFAFILVAKARSLSAFLQGDAQASGLSTLPFWSQAVYRSLVIAFFAIIVFLFGVRKPVLKRLSTISGGVAALTGTFVLILFAGAQMTSTAWTLMVVASVLLICGESFAVVGILFLGRCFGILPEVRGLVTRGPYRYVRHPLYLGEIVAGLGLLLPILSVYTVAVFVGFCGLQYWRAINEEKALTEVFPEYEQYRKTTWRILPGLH